MTEVRVATGHDVSQIVDVHKAAFPEFFLTFLGQAFLTRFYAAVVDDTACLSLVADDGSSILGFVVGPLHPAGFFRGLLLHQGLGFATDAAPAIAKRPLYTARHLLRGLFYRGARTGCKARNSLAEQYRSCSKGIWRWGGRRVARGVLSSRGGPWLAVCLSDDRP